MAYIGYGYGYGRAKKAGGVAYDAMASTYFAAVPNAFDAARKTIINTLIAGLRADGNLTKLDRLWLFANTTTGNAVIDVIGLNSATLVNAPAFAADQGYTGNGSTTYINTNYNPATSSTNYTLNSASIGVYQRKNLVMDSADVGILKTSATASYIYIRPKTIAGNFSSFINTTTTTEVANASKLGLASLIRTASNAWSAYMNGSAIINATQASTALPSMDIIALGYNNNGTPAGTSANEQSILFIGSGAVDIASVYTRIQTYMTSLGTQV